jgi:acyl-CoA reductase-like NAD-dependent aldehyde dehydrogenase
VYDLVNPATGAVFTSIEMTTAAGVDNAVHRALDAFETWRDVAPADRARLLRRFAELVDSHAEELARVEVENAGHTISHARREAGNVRDVLLYYSAAPERMFGRQIPVAGGLDLTVSEPLGVVGVIVPWNYPMPIAAWGFAPPPWPSWPATTPRS